MLPHRNARARDRAVLPAFIDLNASDSDETRSNVALARRARKVMFNGVVDVRTTPHNITPRNPRMQPDNTTCLGTSRARKMQGAAEKALIMLEAARYAKANRGPDPRLARAGVMDVPVALPPGVVRMPTIMTAVPEEIMRGLSYPNQELLRTIVTPVDSK